MHHREWKERFAAFEARKIREAVNARLTPLTTSRLSEAPRGWRSIGNPWTCRYYDGDFLLPPAPIGRPAMSAVFVQSRDGNTGADNPADLGGGATDLHLIYEGLSRVAADGVLAGAGTARGRDVFFSIWHPELVALRSSLGLERHPAQLVVSNRGRLDVDGTLLFNVPEVPVYILAGDGCRATCAAALASRPWIRMVTFEAGRWDRVLANLRDETKLTRLSVIGGRSTVSSLFDAGVVDDLLLTTTSKDAGEPGTPFYVGDTPPRFELIVEKQGTGAEGPITVEHQRI